MSIRVELAEPADLPAILALLAESGLPEAGLKDHVGTLLLAAKGGENGRLLGCGALEIYGSNGLLRSVAVAEDARGRGLGDRITRATLALASKLELSEVYLLTETAQAFFARHGFLQTERATVPTAVCRSVEFSSACPASAVAMVKRFGNKEAGEAGEVERKTN
ncbi:MAG: arsenic resistance N-acetyltransferase ArsN2 [Candidatus Palauibacterales bacterium]|nr:arsenic resistance N-acetyltransferase ArsN2 [Candidatus Palauibacterales bacterium]